jgi:hypothetical protein
VIGEMLVGLCPDHFQDCRQSGQWRTGGRRRIRVNGRNTGLS